MFWWIDHLIVMFPIRFSGRYWHFWLPHLWWNDRGPGDSENSFPWPWQCLWRCWHHVTCHPMSRRHHPGLGKTVSVTKLSSATNPTQAILKATEMSILSRLSFPIALRWQWQKSVFVLKRKVNFAPRVATAPYNHLWWRPAPSPDNCLSILLLAPPAPGSFL